MHNLGCGIFIQLQIFPTVNSYENHIYARDFKHQNISMFYIKVHKEKRQGICFSITHWHQLTKKLAKFFRMGIF